MMSESTDKARKIKRKHEKEWLSVDGVTAVGIGLTSQGDVGIIISVSNDAESYRDKFPSKVENIPIKIQVSGKFRAH